MKLIQKQKIEIMSKTTQAPKQTKKGTKRPAEKDVQELIEENGKSDWDSFLSEKKDFQAKVQNQKRLEASTYVEGLADEDLEHTFERAEKSLNAVTEAHTLAQKEFTSLTNEEVIALFETISKVCPKMSKTAEYIKIHAADDDIHMLLFDQLDTSSSTKYYILNLLYAEKVKFGTMVARIRSRITPKKEKAESAGMTFI